MIEIVKFRLNDDVRPEEFLERNADFQQHFVYQQEGVQRRIVASGLDGAWIAITWWRSMKDARQCQSEQSTSSAAAGFTSMLDPSSVETDFFKELPG
jgi:hypothetical protein